MRIVLFGSAGWLGRAILARSVSRAEIRAFDRGRAAWDEWRVEYNHRRPHSGLNWETPAAVAARLAGPPVGATPLPTAQPIKQQQLILS